MGQASSPGGRMGMPGALGAGARGEQSTHWAQGALPSGASKTQSLTVACGHCL